jgi:hypothetical protein
MLGMIKMMNSSVVYGWGSNIVKNRERMFTSLLNMSRFKMYFSFKKKSTKRNLPFCMACAVAYVRFIDVVTSRPCLAMHPEVSGQILKVRDASIHPLMRSL